MLSKNQIKEIQSLQLKKFRDSKKLFIAEGIKTVTEVLDQDPGIIEEIYGTKEFIREQLHRLRQLNIKFTEITDDELKKISLQATPNSAIAVCRYYDNRAVKFNLNESFSFYLDDIRDPGNLGTIIRLSDWFGIAAIYCSPASCDVYNPKVIQSTMGAFLRVKVIYTELSELIIAQNVSNVYGGLLKGKDLYKEKLNNGLIVIGNEANGISDKNLEFINHAITIPSSKINGTESLNAAMAASIIVGEFFRQLRHT